MSNHSFERLGRVLGAACLAVSVAVAGCADVGMKPSDAVTTANPAWTNWFTLEWSVEPDRNGARRITGYVHNGYGEQATGLQLLAQAVDKAGTVIHQRIEWAGRVPPLSRRYFEMRNLPPADQYRVTVWAFDFQQAPDRE